MMTTTIDDFLVAVSTLEDYVALLEQRSNRLVERDANEVVNAMRTAREMDDEVGKIKKRYGALLKNIKEQVVPAKFMEDGISSISVDGYRFTVSHQSRTSIISDQKPAAYAWLREMELGDLITETVNASTLSATAKSLAEDGLDMPDDLFKVFSFDNTSMTKV